MRRLAGLLAAVLALVAITGAQAARRGGPLATLVVPDATNYRAGPWTGYLSPFNASLLHAGDTYSQSMTVVPAAFPAGTTLTFAWPTGYPAPGGVWAFDAIDFGNYYGTTAQAPITPRQVKAITTLAQTHDIAIAGATTGFNVIWDCFLTQAANDFTNRVIEIDAFLHGSTAGKAYAAARTPRGTWTDASGRAWTITMDAGTAPLVMFAVPADGGDALSGTFDAKGLMTWMVAAGLLTGNEWYNGHGFGPEPVQGAGSVTVNSVAITYN